jgi:PST family polysaccharide transporter
VSRESPLDARRLARALRHPISQNAFAIYLVQFAISVLPLVTLPWIARQLGPRELGVVVFSQSFSWILLLLIEFGFSASGARAVARTRDEPERLAGAIAAIQGAKAALSGLAVAAAAISLFAIGIFREHPEYLALALITALLQGFSPGWYFIGIERLRLVSALEVAQRTAAAALTILLVRGPGDGWIVLALWAAGTAVTTGVGLVLLYRRVALRSTTVVAARAALAESWRLFIAGTAVTLYTTANVVFLGILSTTVQAAYYSTAEKVVRAAPRLLTPILTAVFPRISNLVARGEEARARRLTRLSLGLLFVLATLAAAALALFAEPIVHLLFGDEFEPAIGILRILAITLPLSALAAGIVQLELIAHGFDRESVKVVLTAAVVDVALGLFLISKYGAKGTAWTVVVVEVVALSGALYYRRRVRQTSSTAASVGK